MRNASFISGMVALRLSSAVLVLLAGLLLAHETTPITITQVIDRVQSRRDVTDVRATGRLVRLDGAGKRTAYQLSMRARSFDGVVRIFSEIKDPPPARVRVLLESGAARQSTIRLGHAGDARPTAVSLDQWGEPFLGSDFSLEDLMDGHSLWQHQSPLREEKCGARTCLVVRSEPGPSDRSHYSAVTSWLDRGSYFPVKVEKGGGAGLMKEFIYYGLRQSKGLWSASQIEARTKGASASTLLIIARGAAKENVGAGEFDPALLTKPQ